jgi:hypothetical protein
MTWPYLLGLASRMFLGSTYSFLTVQLSIKSRSKSTPLRSVSLCLGVSVVTGSGRSEGHLRSWVHIQMAHDDDSGYTALGIT